MKKDFPFLPGATVPATVRFYYPWGLRENELDVIARAGAFCSRWDSLWDSRHEMTFAFFFRGGDVGECLTCRKGAQVDQNIIRFPLRFAVKRNFFFVSVLLLSNRADPSRHRWVVYGRYPISGKTGLEVVSSLQHCPLVFCIEVNLSDRYGTLKSSSAARSKNRGSHGRFDPFSRKLCLSINFPLFQLSHI